MIIAYTQSSHQRPMAEDMLVGNAFKKQINTQEIVKRCIK